MRKGVVNLYVGIAPKCLCHIAELASLSLVLGIAVAIERWGERETDKGTILDIDAYIYCERDSHKGMVIGKKGVMLKEIASRARTELEELFDVKVNLQCWVKVKEDWRNRQGLLNSFGYRLN